MYTAETALHQESQSGGHMLITKGSSLHFTFRFGTISTRTVWNGIFHLHHFIWGFQHYYGTGCRDIWHHQYCCKTNRDYEWTSWIVCVEWYCL